MELKEGLYIRTKKGIGKIDKTRIFMEELEIHLDSNQGTIRNVKDNTYWNNVDDIIGEPREHLIDLIEVGDYVNGEKVTSAEPVYEKDNERYLGFGDYDYYIHASEDIKSVVTKEQFNSMKYVVERDK